MKAIFLTSTAAILIGQAGIAHAQSAAPAGPGLAADTGTASDIIVTGTRRTGIRAADSAAPIQILGNDALQRVGQQDLTQALAQNLPSLNFQGFGADTANLTLSAALRGLNPNDTLVLINGKRRHFTSNLAVAGTTPYQGAATTDFSFIPVNAIGRVEVLQDGAAAQYGSDAIGGVVNVILKQDDHGGTLTATAGQYYEGDGKTASGAANVGFKLGDRGFVNLTGEYRYHEHSRRGTYDRRYFNLDGTLKSGLNPIDTAGIPRNPDYPYVNKINGDSAFKLYNVFVNAAYQLTDGIEAYGFGSYGHRTANSFQNYRRPSRVRATNSAGATIVPFPTGFSPREALREDDYSVTGGLRGDVAEWHWDLSGTYGRDEADIYTRDSVNPDLFAVQQAAQVAAVIPQTDFYDGTFRNSELVVNLDVKRDFDMGMASPATLALGAEYRRGVYAITQGEPASVFGAGTQGFPGFAPSDQGSYARHSKAAYIDLALNPVEALHLDFAGRYEDYSDFGHVWIGKATGRYDFSPALAVRGTVSNGFRAPTLAESNYSATQVNPSYAAVQLPPNSAAARAAGFAPLAPERSTNFSAGFVAHPAPRVQITADAYQISIRKRIVGSGFLIGSTNDGSTTTVISQGVLDAIRAHGNTLESGVSYAGITIFTNGADTRTRGVEATASYASDFGAEDHIDWSLGLNYNRTKITKLVALPAAVTNAAAGQVDLLSPTARTALTNALPRVKVIANALWTHGRFSLNLRETIYGRSSEIFSLDGTGTNGTLVKIGTTGITDLDVGYRLTDGLKLSVGSNNLFDKRAPGQPNVPDGNGGVRPANGDSVYHEPVAFTPWGINGGYYYARVTFNF